MPELERGNPVRGDTISIIPLLRAAGPLPIDEIWERSPDTADDLLAELKSLQEDGLIAIDNGDIPNCSDDLRSARSVVHLTLSGLRSDIANTA
jgi:hypothetical protein